MTQQNIAYNWNIIHKSTLTHALLLVVLRPTLPPHRPTSQKPSLPTPIIPYHEKCRLRHVSRLNTNHSITDHNAMTTLHKQLVLHKQPNNPVHRRRRNTTQNKTKSVGSPLGSQTPNKKRDPAYATRKYSLT